MIGMEMNPVKPVSTVTSNSCVLEVKAPLILMRMQGLPELPVEPIVVAIRGVAHSEGPGGTHSDKMKQTVWVDLLRTFQGFVRGASERRMARLNVNCYELSEMFGFKLSLIALGVDSLTLISNRLWV
ncbi:MAG TPA: hypothetical protein VMH05_09280 [Bryobacteraceae bacterium]|nr:hypothetical protein [Bryobacteraceae bacterium]